MGLRILIAEDESLVRMGFEMMVTSLGHEVVAQAADGRTAIQLALETEPDLILMDINLPKMTGLEACRQINMQIQVACILISAYSVDDMIQEATALGIISYLVKPVTQNQLKAAISISIQRYRELENARKEATTLRMKLEERKLVERAKGILMDRLQLKEAEAMQRLQKKSRRENKKLARIAEDIIRLDSAMRN